MTARFFKKWHRELATFVACSALIAVPMALLVLTINDQRPNKDDIPQAAAGEFLGVDENHFAYAQQAFAAYPQSFAAGDGQENERKDARIWRLTRAVSVPGKLAGEDFGCGPQETGDCVSWGGARCISECLASQIARGESVAGGVVFQPHQYGVTRRNGYQHQYGQIPCKSSGAIPSLLALNFPTFGLVFYHEVEAESVNYSGRLADDWGCKGVPEKWLVLGKQRHGGETYPIRSVTELRDALCNGYPCTYAGPFKPGTKYAKDNRNCLNWNGRLLGYHQMCVLAYDGSVGRGHEYFWVQNSHGPNATAATKPLQDEPVGGFWVSWQTMESMLASDGEIWAFSAVKGFEQQNIDWSAFDQFRAEPVQQEQKNENVDDDRRASVRSLSIAI
jgi:hypothetical protein